MSTDITMELIEPLLKAIKDSVDTTNKNVIELKADLKIAEKSINETATNYRLVDERLKNHEDRDSEKHSELEKSLSLLASVTDMGSNIFSIGIDIGTSVQTNTMKYGEDLSVSEPIIYGDEVITMIYTAYMDGATPKYRACTSRISDGTVVEGVRTTEKPSINLPLALFADVENASASKKEISGKGIKLDQIIRVASWDRPLSIEEMWGVLYYDKDDIKPWYASDRYAGFDGTREQYQPLLVETATLGDLLHSWDCSVIDNGHILDTVGGLDLVVNGNISIQEGGVVAVSQGDYLVCPTDFNILFQNYESFTCSFMVKFNASSDLNTTGYVLGTNSTIAGNSFGFYVNTGSLWSRPFGAYTVSKDVWYKVQMTWDAHNEIGSYYVDGILDSTSSRASDNSVPFNLFTPSTSNKEYIADSYTLTDVIVKNLTMYSGCATSAEIQQLNSGMI